MQVSPTLPSGAWTRRAVATSVVLAVGAGLCAVTAPTAAAAPGAVASEQETVVPPIVDKGYPATRAFESGATGFLHTPPGGTGSYWTEYATGKTVPAPGPTSAGHSWLRAKQAAEPAADGSRPITLTDLATGAVSTVTLPPGAEWTRAYTKDSVLAFRRGADGMISELSVLTAVDGRTESRPVAGLPEGATGFTTQMGQDFHGAVLTVTRKDAPAVRVLFSYEGAWLTELSQEFTGGDGLRLGGDHVVAYQPGSTEVVTLDRRVREAKPVTTTLPEEFTGRVERVMGSVGDWIVYRVRHQGWDTAFGALHAIPVGGGASRELLREADVWRHAVPDGSLLVAGGSGSRAWGYQRIALGADGAPVATMALPVAPRHIRYDALALGAGRLATINSTEESRHRALYERRTGAGAGAPTVSEPVQRQSVNLSDGSLSPLGEGSYLYIAAGSFVLFADGSGHGLNQPSLGEGSAQRIVDATGRYAVLRTQDGKQHVADLMDRSARPSFEIPATAAAVWGTTLWTPGKAGGTVAWLDLKTKKKSPDLATGSGCVPNDLQAVGRWLLWACADGTAGVWDQKSRTSTPLPGAETKLGDGFAVTSKNGKLWLSDFHQGTGTARTSEIGPAGRFTVDKFGGNIAYLGERDAIHVRRVDVPRTPVGLLEGEADTSVSASGSSGWTGRWQLSVPPVRWSVGFKDKTGRTVRTVASTESQGTRVAARWDGKDSGGKTLDGGRYTWTLSADTGTGMRAVTSGAVDLLGGKTPFRDHGGDGVAELVTQRGTGLTAHQGFDKGSSTGGQLSSSSGWKDINRVLPLGDMTGDRCNDLVVRTTKGELYRHDGACAGLPKPTSPKKRIGAGFSAFDALLSPGDLTGDGRVDLLARVRSTGELYLYADNGSGSLARAVKLSGSWKGLTLIGAGDLTGDGHGDLLARDAGGELWRYNGTGKATATGTFAARKLVFKDWGAGRNAFVGAGDQNGDGKNDLISRDTNGKLLRNLGDGKGSFGATAQIGTGWGSYSGLY
ncbi:FG-GAP-like repeat-containing protein [Streptomyces sp. NPDC057638]|uniref:FG-GAP-like repeat-containing protein n=1 Tax=Streptomyces sp. NPDC057638 TaxID=3346190 RepID=UPI00368B7574